MSQLYVDENRNPVQVMEPKTTQVVAYTDTAAATTAHTNRVLRVVCTTDAHLKVDATATTSDMLVVGSIPEYIEVPSGSTV